MKIKHFLMAFAAMLCTTTFVACGDDEETPADPVKASSFDYTFTVSEDVLSIADVTVSYIDTDGVEYSEAMTTTTWTKKLTANKYGVAAGASLSLKLKSGAELSKATYTLGYGYSYTVASTSDDYVVDYKQSGNSSEFTIEASKIEEALTGMGGTMSFQTDANGAISKATLSWQDNFVRIFP